MCIASSSGFGESPTSTLQRAAQCTHFLKNLVDEATAGEARPSVDQYTLMVQRVGSEQLCFASRRTGTGCIHSCCPER